MILAFGASLNCTFFKFQPIQYAYLNLWSRLLFQAMEFYGKCHKSHKLHTSVEIKNATSVSIQFRVLTFSGNKYYYVVCRQVHIPICLATMDHRMDHRCQKSKQKLDEVLKRNCILLPKGRPCVVVESQSLIWKKRYTFIFEMSCILIPKMSNQPVYLFRSDSTNKTSDWQLYNFILNNSKLDILVPIPR